MYVHVYTRVQLPSEAIKGFRSPRSEVTSDCEPPDLGACDYTQVLYKSSMCF